MLNFPINEHGIISNQFLQLDIKDFDSAANYIQSLAYKRNFDKQDECCVFKDFGGTCSTKHAVLKNLARENKFPELHLMLGIFRMNAANTSGISSVLKKYNLKEMPEAHKYLKYKNETFDFTRKNSSIENFVHDLVQEIEIEPSQITDFKTKYHQDFLRNYLNVNPAVIYDFEDFWKIREECIQALQQ